MIGVDTGFFFALEDQNPVAIKIWKEREIVSSVVVIYELQRKLLQGHFKNWTTVIEDITNSIEIIQLTLEIALQASHIAYGTGMPGLDALILSSFLEAECQEIYTTDMHFNAYQKKGVKIVILNGSML
jgi:predicted nucleic acid-binding protein